MKLIKAFKWAILFVVIFVLALAEPKAILIAGNQTGNIVILACLAIIMIGSIALFARDYKKFRRGEFK